MASVKKSAVPLDIVAAKSPANQYLLHLLEDKRTVSFQQPTEERIQVVFEVLDTLTPQLGVFSKVLQLIRAELYDAIYSSTISASPVSTHSESLKKISYFTLVRRAQDERNDEMEKIESDLQNVKAVLAQREEEIFRLQREIHALEESNRTLEATTADLRLEAEKSGRKIKGLEKDMEAEGRRGRAETREHEQSMAQIQHQLKAEQNKVEQLEQYRLGYEKLREAFRSPLARKRQNVLSPVWKVPAGLPSPAHQAHILSYLQTTRHLHQQLLHVRNQVMDDFDSFLETQFHAKGKSKAEPNEEIEETKKNFLSTMKEISTELSLLSRQRESLEQKVAGSGIPSQEIPDKSQNGRSKTPRLMAKESLQVREDGEFSSLELDPDETLLSRYAAMIYLSRDNGRIYEEVPGASLCNSCGEKTFLCPHKIVASSEICLPSSCTHIKICRPHVHRCSLSAKLQGNRVSAAESAGPRGLRPVLSQKALGNVSSQSTPSPSSWQGIWAPGILGNRLEELLELNREVPRIISLDLCLSLTEQLLAALLHQGPGQLQGPRVLSIQDLLWDLLTKRYLEEDMSSLGLRDFLTAMETYSAHSQVVSLLGHVLQGHLDPAALRYVLLQADMLGPVTLAQGSDFQSFIQQHYPFLQEVERDTLILEFTAYSGRAATPAHIMGFILLLVLRHKEPLILEFEATLTTFAKTQSGSVTADELSDALDDLVPLSGKAERQFLIQQGSASLRGNRIPVRQAARILLVL
ncbi:hypothetical protein XENTR_v10017594 [Xenopus tropicalis]|nr:hypothetical protein XENTR_v10017594 [Xenopus tropicalis]